MAQGFVKGLPDEDLYRGWLSTHGQCLEVRAHRDDVPGAMEALEQAIETDSVAATDPANEANACGATPSSSSRSPGCQLTTPGSIVPTSTPAGSGNGWPVPTTARSSSTSTSTCACSAKSPTGKESDKAWALYVEALQVRPKCSASAFEAADLVSRLAADVCDKDDWIARCDGLISTVEKHLSLATAEAAPPEVLSVIRENLVSARAKLQQRKK